MRKFSIGVSRRFTLWLTLSLLLAVLVPSACLLWFMNQAMQNERLAVRQKLVDAYRGHLMLGQERLENDWKQRAEELCAQAETLSGPALFANVVRAGADAVVVFDTNGNVVYPNTILPSKTDALESDWVAARNLEASDLAAALSAYSRLSRQTTNLHLAALALQAQARCLVQAGKPTAAIEVLTGALADERYQNVTDGQGRLIVPGGALMTVELLKDAAPERAEEFAGRLRRELLDYSQSTMSAPQRRFLMRELQKLAPDPVLAKQLAAEDLAAEYVETADNHSHKPTWLPTSLAGVWQFCPTGERLVLLYRTESLTTWMQLVLSGQTLPSDVRVEVVAPGQEAEGTLVSSPAGSAFQGWRLALSLKDQRAFDLASEQRARYYFWTGVLVFATVVGLALLGLGMIRRQAALTQLRNDLVANVTHELKTPLASTRLLVETLLNSEKLEEKTAREYLELIARENLRLSRLIDNFLTFSRIERNKYTFDFKDVPAASLAETAVAAVRERFNTPECQFKVSIPADLPKVRADADAMVTALLNLLDNAYKYSGESKQIVFTAAAANGSVVFSVTDNGIGLSPRDTKQVFKRFYQVNEHLSRSSGGAGLGLSIVQFIVAAHQGTIRVESELKRGSTFTVTIPASGPHGEASKV